MGTIEDGSWTGNTSVGEPHPDATTDDPGAAAVSSTNIVTPPPPAPQGLVTQPVPEITHPDGTVTLGDVQVPASEPATPPAGWGPGAVNPGAPPAPPETPGGS